MKADDKKIPDDVYQILIGSLLGDGCLFKRKGERTNAQFTEGHSPKQAPYLRWKAATLMKLFGGWICERKSVIHFTTRTSSILTGFRHRWYPACKKIVPTEDLDKLDKLGLAVWYQDDGTYQYSHKICELALYGEFRNYGTLVVEWFKRRWDLTPSLYPNHGGYILHFSVEDSDKFLHLIADCVHPSMAYKLGHLVPVNMPKIEEARRKMTLYNREWVRKNRDRLNTRRRELCRLNSDSINARQREWRQRNHNLYNFRQREYRRHSEKYQKWKEKNRNRIRQIQRSYYWRNREKCLSRKREYARVRRQRKMEG